MPKMPPPGSDFFPLPFALPPEEVPTSDPKNTEYGVALNGIFSGWDVSFYYAQFYDDLFHMERLPGTARIVLRHSRLTMYGGAMNLTSGNWLLKLESAVLSGMEFFNTPGEKKSRADMLAGIEYTGITDSMIAVEFYHTRIFEYDARLKSSPDFASPEGLASAIRFTRDFINDTVHFTAFLITFGETGEEGGVHRFSLAYDVTDSYKVTGGFIAYQPGSLVPYGKMGDSDRTFLDVKYSF